MNINGARHLFTMGLLILITAVVGCGGDASPPDGVTFVKPQTAAEPVNAGPPTPVAAKGLDAPLPDDVDVDQLDGATVAAKVADYEIPLGLLRKNIMTMEEQYKAQYQEKGNLGVLMVYQNDFVGQALSNLIDNRVMLMMALKRDYEVTDQEVTDHISRFTAFQTDGRFDQEKYDRLLLQNNFSREAFEETQREQLLVRRVADAAYQEAQLSDEDVRREYLARESKINLRFLRVSRQVIDQRVEVDEAEANKYFTAHRDKFVNPEARRVDAVVFQAREFLDRVTASDEEVRNYFEKNRDKFAVREQVHARHILKKIPADSGKSEAEVLAEINRLRDRIVKGAAFADVARDNSECPSASRGGDLGIQARGSWAKPFEEAAFALEPGKLSEPVKTQFGYHLIEVLEKRAAEEPSLEKSADKIRLMIKTEKALEIAKQEARVFRDGLPAGQSLTVYAKQKDRPLKTSDLIAQRRPLAFDGEKIADFRAALELSRQIFEMKIEEVGQPFPAGSGVYLVQLVEIAPPKPMDFTDSGVRERCLAAAKNEVLKERLRKKADALLAEVRGGKSLDEVAKKNALPIEETGLFARVTPGAGEAAKQAGLIPKIGRAPELLEKAFALTPEKPLLSETYPVGMDWGIFVLKEAVQPDLQAFEAQKDKIRLQLQGERAQQSLRAQMEEFKRGLKIDINRALIEKMKARQEERRLKSIEEYKKTQPTQ